MTPTLRETLGRRQIAIYFGTVSVAAAIAWLVPGTTVLESAIVLPLALAVPGAIPVPPLFRRVDRGTTIDVDNAVMV